MKLQLDSGKIIGSIRRSEDKKLKNELLGIFLYLDILPQKFQLSSVKNGVCFTQFISARRLEFMADSFMLMHND